MNSLVYEILKNRNLVGSYQKLPTRFSVSGLWNSSGESFQKIPILSAYSKPKITFYNKKDFVRKVAFDPQYQRVTLKANYLSKPVYGSGFYTVFNKHLSYITRSGALIEDNEKKKPELFTEFGREFTTQEFGNEKHIYKYVLSPEHGNKLHLKEYTVDVMKRVQQELGYNLIWAASVHNNTGHPHVHIVARGVDTYGKEITMPKEFQREGFRKIASREATLELGLRTEREIREQKEREVTQDRFTELDKTIKNFALKQQGIHQGQTFAEFARYEKEKIGIQEAGYLSQGEKNNLIQKLDNQNKITLSNHKYIVNFDRTAQKVTVNEATLTNRMDFLCKSGFAAKVNTKGDYLLAAGYERALKDHAQAHDRIKNMYGKLEKLQLYTLTNGQRSQCFVLPEESREIKSGQVILKDFDEEKNRWNVLIKTGKNTYYEFSARNARQLNRISDKSFVIFSGEHIGRNKSELIELMQKTISRNNFTVYNRIVEKEHLENHNTVIPLTKVQIELYKTEIKAAADKNRPLQSTILQLKEDIFKDMKEKLGLSKDISLYSNQGSPLAGKVIDKGTYHNKDYVIVEQANKKYLVLEQREEMNFGFNAVQRKINFKNAEINDRINISPYSRTTINRDFTRHKQGLEGMERLSI